MPADSHAYASLTADDLVTGEAVALDLPAADLAARLVSGTIDLAVTAVVCAAVALLLIVAAIPTSEALVWAALIGTLIVALLVLPTTVETLTWGRSLGKWVMGLRTVRDDAGPISFQHAFVRALIGIVEIYGLTGMPAFFSALISPRGKRLGDYAAGTYVVRERFALELPPPIPMPASMAQWARTADIAPLPVGLALSVRQFLGRAHLLDPGSRDRLAAQLATSVSAYLAPPPPAGTPAETLLAAVLASRRATDAARLGREADLRARLAGRC